MGPRSVRTCFEQAADIDGHRVHHRVTAEVAGAGPSMAGEPVVQIYRVAGTVTFNSEVSRCDVDARIGRVLDGEGRRGGRCQSALIGHREGHRGRTSRTTIVAQRREVVAPGD